MEPGILLPWLAITAVMLRELLWLCAGGILLSNLDDLAMDFCWLATLFRPRRPVVAAAPLRHAVLIPAWDESAVIGAMLRRFLDTQLHPHYRLLVGVYPNDPETIAAVSAIADARVQMTVMPHPGPTTKADCLNQLWLAVIQQEDADGRRFDSIILHDSEDVVHARELQLFDSVLPALAMAQVPVLPLIDRNSHWISGHYLDEFAQNHIRDMIVRGALGAPVPSAGVGTAIRRDAMEAIARQGAPFDATSLTEDYEIGHRLHALGLPAAMVRHRAPDHDGQLALVAVQEYFPARLDDSVRQKSRWLVGIALAGWDRLGWNGNLAARWMLLRDRKGLFTAALAAMAYALAAMMAAHWIIRALIASETGAGLPPLLLDQDPLLVAILTLNALLLAWRLIWRAGFTMAAHGVIEGLRAIPRALVTNAINALAAWHAVQRYARALQQGRSVAWDKTAHRFPGAASG